MPSRPFPTRFLLPALFLAFAALAPLDTAACRYSVRDTGFVDLDQPPWLVRLSWVPEPRLELWHEAARLRLRDSNLRLDSESTPGPEGVFLVDAGRRSLPLLAGEPLPATQDAITALLERVALSPARDQLHEQLLRAFAVLVLVEGSDPARTAAARRTAEDAIRDFTPLLRSLPKPVDTPPQLLVLPVRAQAAERILVWSLGFDPAPSPEPRLAVVYGRGRRAGQPLEGPLVTRTALSELLALIGQDCECDLDRALLQGPVFPARWDSTRQATAAKLLGFDPENPLVRTEVTRIVLRGAGAGTARRSPTSAFDTLALGYSEEPVTPEPEDSATTNAIAPIPPIPPISPNPSPQPTAAVPEPPPTTYWRALLAVAALALVGGAWFLVQALRSR